MTARRSVRRAGGTIAVLVAALCTAVAWAPSAASGDPVCAASGTTMTCTYSYTGAEQTFTVPAGVTHVRVVAYGGIGGRGGDGNNNSEVEYSPGGRGGYADATVAVSGGQTVYIEVGGNAYYSDINCNIPAAAQCRGGWNGGADNTGYGGGGGGASDVRTVSRTVSGTLESRLVVAAGGGGGGSTIDTPGGTGGDGGDPGYDGVPFGTSPGGSGGGAGTATAGGKGGIAPFDDPEDDDNGADGTFGEGGVGGCPCESDGGGGGGGYYGGGGGSKYGYDAASMKFPGSGGGGGGGNYAPGGSTGAGASGQQPTVTISYTLSATTISTQASGDVALGGSIHDSATLGNVVDPQGTLYFAVYGPDDRNCTNEAPATFAVPANGSTQVTSGDFTPDTPGVYRWIAVYGGDQVNAAASGACNDADETVVVGNHAPTIHLVNGACSATRSNQGSVRYLIADADGDPLRVTVVANSNPALTPPRNVVLSGSGSTRTLTVTTAATGARGTLTLRVYDGTTSTYLIQTVIAGPNYSGASFAGTSDNDLILAGKPATIGAASGDDVVCGSSGNDTLDGGAGRDVVDGRGGADKVMGGKGIDILRGGAGNDRLTGGIGPDAFSGGAGSDTNVDYDPAEGDTRDGT